MLTPEDVLKNVRNARELYEVNQGTSRTDEEQNRRIDTKLSEFNRENGNSAKDTGDKHSQPGLDTTGTSSAATGTRPEPGKSGERDDSSPQTHKVKSTFDKFRMGFKKSLVTQVTSDKKDKPKTRVFTEVSVAKSRSKLIEALTWGSEHLDEFIQATTKGHETVSIWSSMTLEEIEIIADSMLSRAKVDSKAAYTVNKILDLYDRIKVHVIILPRVYETFMIYITRGVGL
jgi:hypothetical protein